MNNTFVLIGGGRWARVLLPVIQNFTKHDRIIWVTKHGYQKNKLWLTAKNFKNVDIQQNETNVWNSKTKGVFIANKSFKHEIYLEKCIKNNIPAYSEKPFSYNHKNAARLVENAQKKHLPVGVNLEYVYASYLEDFRNVIGKTEILNISITWHDPFTEKKYGETKYADVYTPIVYDTLPHCLSILATVFQIQTPKILSLRYLNGGQVKIEFQHENRYVYVSLDRRASKRVRKLDINTGAHILDFSKEPGYIISKQKTYRNRWKKRRPLELSIEMFLKSIKNNNINFPTSLQNYLHSILLTELAFIKLDKAHKQKLNELRKTKNSRADNPEIRALAMDMMMPKLVEKESFYRDFTDQKITNLAKSLITKKFY